MMGQQQETVAGSALRRIIMVLAVATVMAAMMPLIKVRRELSRKPPCRKLGCREHTPSRQSSE